MYLHANNAEDLAIREVWSGDARPQRWLQVVREFDRHYLLTSLLTVENKKLNSASIEAWRPFPYTGVMPLGRNPRAQVDLFSDRLQRAPVALHLAIARKLWHRRLPANSADTMDAWASNSGFGALLREWFTDSDGVMIFISSAADSIWGYSSRTEILSVVGNLASGLKRRDTPIWSLLYLANCTREWSSS